MTNLNATLTAEYAKKVFDLIEEDLRAGVYAHVPGAVTELASYADLHDFVDANDYVGEVCGWDASYEQFDAVADLVSLLLSENPIPLV